MKFYNPLRYITFCLTALAMSSCGVETAYNNGEECYPEGGTFWKCEVSEYCDRSAKAPVCKKLDVKCEGSKSEFDNGYGYCLPGYVCIGGNCGQLEEGLGFCSEQTAATVCGRNAQCVENVCKCGDVGCTGVENTCCMAENGTGGCFDLQSDQNNCGECGHACVDLQSCEAGACVCPQGLVFCDSKCIDPLTDVKFCGAKGACSQSDSASEDYQGNACGSDQLCIDGICNNNIGSVVCSWKYDKDKDFYKYLEYPSEEQCRETLNKYYACSETLHALTDMYLSPVYHSSGLSVADQLSLLSVLYPVYRYGSPDYCSSEFNGGLCLLNGHNIFAVSKSDLPGSSVDIASLIAPEKVFKPCGESETCKVSDGSASCILPSACNASAACLSDEICSGSCLQAGRAECVNYSEDCMDNALCHDGYCYFKTIAANSNTYPCSETRCCADGLYCLNDTCSEQPPSFAGEYTIYSKFSIAESYEPVQTDEFILDEMTDDKWFAFVQQSIKSPIRTLFMFITDNFFANNIPFDKKYWIEISTNAIEIELGETEGIKKLTAYSQTISDKIRHFDLQGKLTLNDDLASSPQVYAYSIGDGYELSEEVTQSWTGQFLNHAKMSCYPALRMDGHALNMSIGWLWYQRYYNNEIPELLSFSEKGLTGYLKNITFAEMAKRCDNETLMKFIDSCKNNGCGIENFDELMEKINASDDSDDAVIYAKSAAWILGQMLIYISKQEGNYLLIAAAQYIESNGFPKAYRIIADSMAGLEDKIKEVFERNSKHYQISSESCDFYHAENTFGRKDENQASLDDIFVNNIYTSQCKWQIRNTINSNNKLPLYGVFYAEKSN